MSEQDDFKAKEYLDLVLAKLNAAAKDAKSFDNGNGNAGTRLRKLFAELKTTMHQSRLAIQTIKNTRKKAKQASSN